MADFAIRYARAFAEVAAAAGLYADTAKAQMMDFADALAISAELRELLLNPSVEVQQKVRVLDALAARLGLSVQVRNFLAVVLEHHRMDSLTRIVAAYAELADVQSGAAEASITSARPLNEQDRAQLEAQIAALTGSKVRARYVEDPTLLGGVVVQVGSTVYDGSLRAQLQQLKQTLVNA